MKILIQENLINPDHLLEVQLAMDGIPQSNLGGL
jgi:hypothetical protein